MNLIDLIRRLVREETNQFRGVVSNIHGTVAGESPPLDAAAPQDWLWTKVPAKALLSFEELSATIAEAAGLQTDIVSGKEGVTRVEGTQQLHFIRGTTVVPVSTAIPMIATVGGPGAEVAIYIDGTLQRRAAASLQISAQLDAGTHIIEVVAYSESVTIQLPRDVTIRATLEKLRAPEWIDVDNGYLDPVMGVAANVLEWVNDSRAGGWRVMRRATELLGELYEIGSVNPQGEYAIVLSGDLSGALDIGEELTAGPDSLGVVIGTVYDGTGDETYARLRLPYSLTNPALSWVGRQVGSGRFDELARIRRSSSTNSVIYKDQNVRVGSIYEYKLQAFGRYDETQVSPWSEIRYTRAGDIDPPGPIAFARGYPRLEGRRINCRFSTPSDEDYAGVKVYFRASPYRGVVTGATIDSITDSSQTWALNQFRGYTVHVFSGGAQTNDLWGLVASSDITTLYTSGDMPSVPGTGRDFEMFFDRPVLTDFGSPNSEDQFAFDAIRDTGGSLDLGTYLFKTFDYVGNEQTASGDDGAQSWTFSGTEAPRTVVEFENRDALDVLSTVWTSAYFTVTPEITRIESGTLNYVSGDVVQDYGAPRFSGQYVEGATNHAFIWMYPQGDPSATSPVRPVLRRVVATEAPYTLYLDQAVPSGGFNQVQSGDTYEIYNGATYARVGIDRAASLQQLLPIDGRMTFKRVGAPYAGLYVDFYSVVDGLEAEALRTTFVDDDDIAEISRLILAETVPGTLYVRIDGWDDDTRYWRCYARKALADDPVTGWPTTTGLKDGPYDERYLRWDDSLRAGNSFEFAAGDGCWYVIAVPVNSVNEDGPRVCCVQSIGGVPCTPDCVTSGNNVFYDVAVQEFDDPVPTQGKNLIRWKFRTIGISPTRLQFRLRGSRPAEPTIPSRELTYNYRTTLGSRYVDQDARLGSNPTANELADGAVAVGVEASFVHDGLPVHMTQVLGGQIDEWDYVLEAYDGATLVDQYPVSFTSYYNMSGVSSGVQFTFVNAYNAYPGNNTPACDDPYTNVVEWGITPAVSASDHLYTLKVWFQRLGDNNTYLLVDGLGIRDYTSWHHAINGYVKNASCVGPMAVAHRYYIEIIQAPNFLIDSAMSAWISDTVYVCDGVPNPTILCP
jgi:hypothetical protein